jgi:hypothetical protein
MRFQVSLRGMGMCVAFAASVMLVGCGSGVVPVPSAGSSAGTPSTPSSGTPSNPSTGSPGTGNGISGNVYGGQTPLSAANVFLYAAGTSGYGAGATSLLSGTGAVTTNSSGAFSIAGAYTCPSASTQVYAVAVGGDSGGGANSSAVLMSALGNCGDVGSKHIVLNEATTVASVYALAQFMTPGSTAVGTSSTNQSGLVNAFRTVTNLYDGETGQTRTKTPAGNGTVPTSTINSLANVLAACVDSPGGSAACTKLFQATTVGGTAPRDTLAAMLNVALNPGMNLKSLTLSGPFTPALAGAPNDWTLSLEYTGGGLNQGQLIAADGAGNIWVPNAVDPGTLSEFSTVGEPLSGNAGFPGGGLSYPQAVAVDLQGNVWTANVGNNTVSKHTSGGSPLSGTGFTGSGLKEPYALAIDGNGNVFTTNGNDTVTKLSASGVGVAQFQQGGLDFPYAVAVDSSQNVWVSNYGVTNSVSKFSNTGTAAASSGFTGGGLSGAVGVAIDANGNAWVANFDNAVVSKLDSSGAPLSGSGYAVPADVASIAVDGNNTVWTANTDGSISHLSNTGAAISPATGYISNGATAEVGIAIDASGNVWTTDNYVNSIFEYVGAASPAAVPLQAAVKNKQLGKRP